MRITPKITPSMRDNLHNLGKSYRIEAKPKSVTYMYIMRWNKALQANGITSESFV